MPCLEGPCQFAQSRGAATKEPQSNQAQSKDSATRRKDVKDGEGKHAKMLLRIKDASMRDKPQARENGTHSETVAGVEAAKTSFGEKVDTALVGEPGSVTGAEATDQDSGGTVQKGLRMANEMRPQGSDVQYATTLSTTQSREEMSHHGVSITPGRVTSMQDKQVWALLAEPDGQGIQLVTSMES